jgi:hypothetical protein
MNISELPWPDPVGAAMRVRHMQRKLHHWAVSEPDRRFDDVFNLVHHPDFLTVAWDECGATGALGPPVWTGSARPLSPRMVVSRTVAAAISRVTALAVVLNSTLGAI